VNFTVVVLAAVFAFCVVTYVAVATMSNKVIENSTSAVALGQQAVKLLTNHFSLFAVVALVLVEIAIVRIVRHQWAVASVSAAVLQLMYLNVVGAASRLLHHVPMTFYDSTNYMSGNTSSSAVLGEFTLDVLDADVRIDFRTNTAHYIGAWLVLTVFGVGVPLWFAGAFRLLERSDSTEEARRKLQFLVDNYKATQWYWESVVTTRKGLSVGLIAALAGYPVLQLQAVMLLFAGYLVLEEHFDPFLSDRRRAAERTSYATALVTCNALLAMYSVGDELFTVVTSALMIATQIAAVFVFAVVIYVDYTDKSSVVSVSAPDSEGSESLSEREVTTVVRPFPLLSV
jgi:hypothetical protein